jgi:hypothetical protein
MAVLYDTGWFAFGIILQMMLLYFCLEFMLGRFLYRFTIKLFLYGLCLLLRICTVFWISSRIVAWLLTFAVILFLCFYYQSSRCRKYLIAAVFSTILVFGGAYLPLSFTAQTLPLIGTNLLLQYSFMLLYLVNRKRSDTLSPKKDHSSLQQAAAPSSLLAPDLSKTSVSNNLYAQDLSKTAASNNLYASDLPETAASITRFRHDLKHHIVTLLHLAEQEDCSAIIQYLNTMEADISAAARYISTNNPGIDSIINTMIAKAANNNCLMNADVLIPERMNIPLSGINIILGNLLENAIEAASLSEEKKVSISLYVHKGVLYIDVSNTYGNKLTWQSERMVTNKKTGKHHGVGLRSVEATVKHLNGIMEYQNDEKIFRTLIMLYIE